MEERDKEYIVIDISDAESYFKIKEEGDFNAIDSTDEETSYVSVKVIPIGLKDKIEANVDDDISQITMSNKLNSNAESDCMLGTSIRINKLVEHQVKGFNKELLKTDSELETNQLSLFQCDSCEYTACSDIDLERHIHYVHTSNKPFKCAFCAKMFQKELSLHVHSICHTAMAIHLNPGEKNYDVTHYYVCPIMCSSKFKCRQGLLNHLSDFHGSQEIFICEYCKFTCLSEITLESHEHSEQHRKNKKTYQICTICFERCMSLNNHNCHYRQNLYQPLFNADKKEVPRLKKRFPCLKCGYKATSYNLKQHMAIHEECKSFQCKQCSKAFTSSFRLKRHMRNAHTNKALLCEKCPFRTNVTYELKRHINIVHNRKHTQENIRKPCASIVHNMKKLYHVCKTCSLKFINISDLRCHAKTKHNSTDEFYCDDCDFSCEFETDFNSHKTNHSNSDNFTAKKYSCSLCNYVTFHRGALRRHEDTMHSADGGVKKAMCDICSMRFYDNGNLNKHMVSHQKDRPFSCQLCDYKAKSMKYLKSHMRTHSEEKSFTCKQCSFTTRTSNGLKRHTSVVHLRIKPYLCFQCPYSSSERNKVRRHEAKVHGKEHEKEDKFKQITQLDQ